MLVDYRRKTVSFLRPKKFIQNENPEARFFEGLVMNFESLIGLTAGILTSISLLPQLIKTIKEKEAKSLSLAMMLVLITGIGLWIYYGFLKQDAPILITNTFSEIVNLTLLFFSILYKKKEA